jgi:hypothetical protein
MSTDRQKHAHQRYSWYEQIIADGLHDLVGVAHVIAQNDWIIGYDRLASSLRVHRTGVISKVQELVDRGHLTKMKGAASRGKEAANIYGMVIKPRGSENTTPWSSQIATPGVVKSLPARGSEIATRFSSSSSQESSQEISQESPLSNSRLGKKKEKPPKIKNEVVDQGSFNPHPDPAQGSTTPTKAKQNGIGFDDDDDEISKLLNKFAIEDQTYRQLKKLKGNEAPAILRLAAKKADNPKGYILTTIKNAEQELATAERLDAERLRERREFIRLFDADWEELSKIPEEQRDPRLKHLRKTIWKTFTERRNDDPRELWEKYLQQKHELEDNLPYEDWESPF